MQDHEKLWTDGGFRLFLSHSSVNKVLVAEVKKELLCYGVQSFVAHEDITPSKEWLREIQNALQTCNALVAFLSERFRSSDYCDHEVGYALCRSILVIPVSLEKMNPYGLMAPLQSFSAYNKGPKRIAEEIWTLISSDARTKALALDAKKNKEQLDEMAILSLVNKFLSSQSSEIAAELFHELTGYSHIPRELKNKVKYKWAKNSCILKGVGEKKMSAWLGGGTSGKRIPLHSVTQNVPRQSKIKAKKKWFIFQSTE
jgi:hypothetical protein